MLKKYLIPLFLVTLMVFLMILFITYIETNWSNPNVPLELPIRKLEEKYLDYPILPQRLFDIKNFKYILNNENICTDAVKYIWIITSYADHVELRSAIRRAYSDTELKSLGVRRIFLLAQLPNSNHLVSQNALQNENKRFNDLIQGNFYEAYKNLTYKHIMGLKWVSEFCSQATYLIKMDDDIVLNLYQLIDVLNLYNLSNSILGFVFNNMKPKRKMANKWFVSHSEYSQEVYPSFVSGWLYVTSPQVAYQLVLESLHVPYFWIDDLYVTGILTKDSQIKLINRSEMFSVHYEYIACCLQEMNYFCDFSIGPNGGNNNLIIKFQELSSKCYKTKCKKRDNNLTETCIVKQNNLQLVKGISEIQLLGKKSK